MMLKISQLGIGEFNEWPPAPRKEPPRTETSQETTAAQEIMNLDGIRPHFKPEEMQYMISVVARIIDKHKQ